MDALSSQLSQQCRQFTISEIHSATRNFDESMVIGRGGFGRVYKGIITNGATHLVAAIKRLDSTSNQGAVEFWNEVHMLSKLRHCHLVSLIGYCSDGQEMIIVYEYMPHGTLEDHLHKFRMCLTWVRRLKICVGAARGLDYLHTGTGIKHGVIHRDVKSSNILLDDSWAAKISDFGLSKLGPINQPLTYVNTFVKGTFGYLDPDYFSTGRLTRKSDVYAFGVVLFEVLSGKRAVDKSLDDEHWGLVNWAQESIKEGRLKQIVEDNIRERILPKCLKKFARLADWCLHSNPKQRPTMTEVVVSLESILALQEKASNTLDLAGKTIFWGRRLTSLELFFNTVGGENRILRKFKFETINAATENFSVDILQCNYGSMYKGRLQNGQEVLVGRYHSKSRYQGFKNEVSLMITLKHENLLQLVGYSIEGEQVFLVYESAHYATLYHWIIYGRILDWNKLSKILVGVARALVYLHQNDVIHGVANTGNILLDESLNPKLSDFGLAMCLPVDGADDYIPMDMIYGEWIRNPPEYVRYALLSPKSDVFCFGMLILETITEYGSNIHQDAMTLLRYVWENWLERTSSNTIDPTLHTRFIHIGLLCVQLEASDRPTMEEVVGMLTNTSSLTLPIPECPMPKLDLDSDFIDATCNSGPAEDFSSDLCPR